MRPALPPTPLVPASRRTVLGWSAASLAGVWLRPLHAQAPDARDAPGTQLAAAIAGFAQGQPVRTGRVTLDIARIVDNGNTVPVTVQVDSPMTLADHVVSIAIFNDRNPQPGVAVFTLDPRAGVARVSTRIRLATSQQLAAVARMADGSLWSQQVEVVVALAACLEGG